MSDNSRGRKYQSLQMEYKASMTVYERLVGKKVSTANDNNQGSKSGFKEKVAGMFSKESSEVRCSKVTI